MFATGCVEAAIRSNEALYRLATDNMRLDYFIDIFCSNPAVPNPVWIYNDIRSMFALVKAAGWEPTSRTWDDSATRRFRRA